MNRYLEKNIESEAVDAYLKEKGFDDKYAHYARCALLEFIYILNSYEKSIENLDYETIDMYYKLKLSVHGDSSSFNKRICFVKCFLEYCGVHGLTDEFIGRFMRKDNYHYYLHMIKVMRSIEVPDFLKSPNEFDHEVFNTENVKAFKDKYRDEQYKTCFSELSTEACSVIDKFRMFAKTYNISFSEESIEFWTSHIIEGYYKTFYLYRRIMMRFYEMISTGSITFSAKGRYRGSVNYDDIPDWSKSAADEYIMYRKRLGYGKSTVCMDRNALARFLKHIDSLGVRSYEQIDDSALKSFNENDPHETAEGKNAYLSRVKSFLRYMYEYHDMKPLYLSIFLKSARVPRKIVTVADEDFLEAVKGYTQYSCENIDYRDYAMYLLALRTGLRASDIVSLKFSSISFKDMSIRTIQTKTQKEMITSMPMDVANAIYRYVKHARPQNDSDYIFLTAKAPYGPVDRSVTCCALDHMENKVGIKRPKGFHMLRRTFATKLLQNGRSLDEVALALGHEGTSTVRKYIMLDEDRMALCTLELGNIGLGEMEYED